MNIVIGMYCLVIAALIIGVVYGSCIGEGESQ